MNACYSCRPKKSWYHPSLKQLPLFLSCSYLHFRNFSKHLSVSVTQSSRHARCSEETTRTNDGSRVSPTQVTNAVENWRRLVRHGKWKIYASRVVSEVLLLSSSRWVRFQAGADFWRLVRYQNDWLSTFLSLFFLLFRDYIYDCSIFYSCLCRKLKKK